jgi:excisionase family DNA binding protein
MIEEKKEFLSVGDVASELGVSRPHIQQLVKTGKLGAFKIGHRIVINREQLNEFLNSNKTNIEGNTNGN